jgi:hypothetical protein
MLVALAVLITITRNWNAWEGDKVEQITDDAYVRGDLTPLSTKVPGIVRAVHLEDFQQVHKGDPVPSFAGFLYLSAGLALLFTAIQQGQRLDSWRSGVFNALDAGCRVSSS